MIDIIRTVLTACVLLCVSVVFAQQTDTIEYDTVIPEPEFTESTNNTSYIKVNLTTIFEYEPAIQLAYSYPLWAGRFQMQHELGYVTWNRAYFPWLLENLSYHGFRLRNQLRYYYTGKPTNMELEYQTDYRRNYVALDLMYKYGNMWWETEISRQGGAYFENIGLISHKHVGAVHLVIGVESEFLSGSNVILDYYAGVGMRYKELYSNEEEVDNMDLSPFFYDELGWQTTISFMAGIRLGFGL